MVKKETGSGLILTIIVVGAIGLGLYLIIKNQLPDDINTPASQLTEAEKLSNIF